jgi:hypothetical protein
MYEWLDMHSSVLACCGLLFYKFERWWLGSVPKETVSRESQMTLPNSKYQGQRSLSPAEIYAQVTGAVSRLEMAGVAYLVPIILWYYLYDDRPYVCACTGATIINTNKW